MLLMAVLTTTRRVGFAGRIAGSTGRIGGAGCHLLRGRAHLGHCGNYLIGLPAMTMHLLVVVLAQMVQLVDGAEEVVAGLPDLTHHRLDPLDEAVEGAGQR